MTRYLRMICSHFTNYFQWHCKYYSAFTKDFYTLANLGRDPKINFLRQNSTRPDCICLSMGSGGRQYQVHHGIDHIIGYSTLDIRTGDPPLLVMSGADHGRPVQTCSFGDLAGSDIWWWPLKVKHIWFPSGQY